MDDLDLDAIRERLAEWREAQEASYGLPDSEAARVAGYRAMDCGHDVPDLLAEVERLRAELAAEQTGRERARCNFDDFARASAEELRQALAEVERLKHNAAALVAAKGVSWADGYETGCSMSHSLGCDAVAAERDQLREEVERLRSGVAGA